MTYEGKTLFANNKENVSFVSHIQPLRLTRTTHTQKTENNNGR